MPVCMRGGRCAAGHCRQATAGLLRPGLWNAPGVQQQAHYKAATCSPDCAAAVTCKSSPPPTGHAVASGVLIPQTLSGIRSSGAGAIETAHVRWLLAVCSSSLETLLPKTMPAAATASGLA
eukprot:364933-Chlamydomonas_euryale.AAC.6